MNRRGKSEQSTAHLLELFDAAYLIGLRLVRLEVHVVCAHKKAKRCNSSDLSKGIEY